MAYSQQIQGYMANTEVGQQLFKRALDSIGGGNLLKRARLPILAAPILAGNFWPEDVSSRTSNQDTWSKINRGTIHLLRI